MNEKATGSVITEAIMLVSIIIAASVFSGMFMSNMVSFQNVFTATSKSNEDKLKTSIKIIFAAKSSTSEVKVWVKNNGIAKIHGAVISKSDLFFGPVGNFKIIPYGSGNPYWAFIISNDVDGDGHWDSGETIEITIYWGSTLASGDYYVCFTTYNGVKDSYEFSIGA